MGLLSRRHALPLTVAAALALFPPLTPPAAAQPKTTVGRIAEAYPLVQGWEQPTAARELRVTDPVHLGMSVRTGRGAGARITVGKPEGGGQVKLGPETEVRFSDWVADAGSGKIRKFSLAFQLGQLWAAFAPPPGNEPREGEYWIVTPSGARIVLLGTYVYLQVEPDGSTSVYVLEGSVRIEPESGEPLHLKRGFWTRVSAGGYPSPPERMGPSPPPLDVSGPPGEREITAPLPLDVRDIRLDLPKSGRPPR